MKTNTPSQAMRLRTSLPLLALLVCLSAGCEQRAEDKAAKARIFSPQQPVGAMREAKQELDAHRLADDPALAHRVLQMPAGEVAARLGAHKTSQQVSFAVERPADKSAPAPAPNAAPDAGPPAPPPRIASTEEASSLDDGAGGFQVRLSNDHGRGFEVVWAQGQLFVKDLFGPFHARRTDRFDAAAQRDQALSAMATFDRLARGLKLQLVGDVEHEGRPAVKYAIAGGGRGGEVAGRKLPPISYPLQPGSEDKQERGPDADTARRLAFLAQAEASDLSGSLIVDAQTAAPLSCELSGKLRMAGKEPATAGLKLSLHREQLGKVPAISAPTAEPDPVTAHAVKNPLRFWEKGARAKPAATAPAEGEKAQPSTPAEEGNPDEPAESEAPEE